MAEGDMGWYNNALEQMALGVGDLGASGDVIKISLHTSYTLNIDTHQVWADVSGTEYSAGSGYTAGGETLANQTVTQDDANDRMLWDGDDVVWTSLGPLTPNIPDYAIIRNTTQAGEPLIGFVELGVSSTINGTDYTIQFSSSPSALLSVTNT